jgi:hypothetical protein
MRLFLVLGERDRETLDRSLEIRYAVPKVTILGLIHARLGPFRCVLTAAWFRIWSLIGSNGRGERGVRPLSSHSTGTFNHAREAVSSVSSARGA